MNIIDAIKSGKRFMRKSQPNQGFWYHAGSGLTFYVNDILADDWEIESEAVWITREDFDAAWRRAVDVSENMEIKTFHYLYELVVRELGL